MIKLNEIKRMEFTITWRLLYLGFTQEYFDGKDVIDYAIDKLRESDDEEVCELAGTGEYEKDRIRELLQELMLQESTQDEVEFRKIRATAVSRVLQSKNENYIDGLMELTELWVGFDFPNDSPHTFQGRYNEITPEEYYTQENYENLFNKNILWLNKEVSYLKKYQGH